MKYLWSKDYKKMTAHIVRASGESLCKLEKNSQRIDGRLDQLTDLPPADRRMCKNCLLLRSQV